MAGNQARTIARETAISVLINTAISALMTWLLFGGAEGGVERGAVLLDFVPQTFMVALMGSLVPSAIAVRTRRKAAHVNAPAVPAGRLILRCILIALLATVVLGGIGATLVIALCGTRIAFPNLIFMKMAYGALVAAVVTPIALSRALSEASDISASASLNLRASVNKRRYVCPRH